MKVDQSARVGRTPASRSDLLLEKIASKLDFAKDTIIVHSDHGQIDAGGHGGHETLCCTEPFVMAGNAIKPGAYPDMEMVDIAPTVSAILGANFPASSTGHVLLNMLNLPQNYAESYTTAEETVHTQVNKLYSEQVGEPQLSGETPELTRAAKLATESRARLPFVLIFLTVPLIVVFRRKNKFLKYWLIGALITLVVFYVRYALIDGKLFSFSVIDTPTAFISYTAITTIIAVIVGYFAMLLIMNPVLKERLDAAQMALGYAFTTIYLLLFPVGWNFWQNGFIPTWTLPRLDAYFLGLLALVIILITAIAGLLLVLLSYFLQPYLSKAKA